MSEQTIKTIDFNGFQFSKSSSGIIIRKQGYPLHITACINNGKLDIHVTDENVPIKNKDKSKKRKKESILKIDVKTIEDIVGSFLKRIEKDMVVLYKTIDKKTVSEIQKMKGCFYTANFEPSEGAFDETHYEVKETGHKDFRNHAMFPNKDKVTDSFNSSFNFEVLDLTIYSPEKAMIMVNNARLESGENITLFPDVINEEKIMIITEEQMEVFHKTIRVEINHVFEILENIFKKLNKHFPFEALFEVLGEYISEGADKIEKKVTAEFEGSEL